MYVSIRGPGTERNNVLGEKYRYKQGNSIPNIEREKNTGIVG
jgi:hypothetical protein